MANRTVAARVVLEGVQQYKQGMASLVESNKSLGSSSGNLGDQVRDLSGKLGISLPEGATKALSGITGFSAGTMAAMGGVAAAVAAAIEAIKALQKITLEAAANADDLITKSMITSVNTQTLQQWTYAQNLIDVSVSTMTGSLSKLTRSMYDAQTGNAETAAAFETLGVSITNADGSLRTAEQVFYDVIDALGGVGSQTERDALAMAIMGRSAQDLNPLILQGSEALRSLANDAEKAGYVLDESQIKKLGEVDDEYQKLQLQIEATKKELALSFAPYSKMAMEVVADAARGLTKVLEVLNDTTVKLGRALRDVVGIHAPQVGYGGLGSDIAGAEWKDDVQAWVSKSGVIIAPDNYDLFDKTTGQLIGSSFGGESTTFMLGSGEPVYSYGHMDEEDILKLIGNNAAGTDNWRGGLTWVGESGPELVNLPRGSQVYNSQDSRSMAPVYIENITIDAKEISDFNRVVDIVLSQRVRRRMA